LSVTSTDSSITNGNNAIILVPNVGGSATFSAAGSAALDVVTGAITSNGITADAVTLTTTGANNLTTPVYPVSSIIKNFAGGAMPITANQSGGVTVSVNNIRPDAAGTGLVTTLGAISAPLGSISLTANGYSSIATGAGAVTAGAGSITMAANGTAAATGAGAVMPNVATGAGTLTASTTIGLTAAAGPVATGGNLASVGATTITTPGAVTIGGLITTTAGGVTITSSGPTGSVTTGGGFNISATGGNVSVSSQGNVAIGANVGSTTGSTTVTSALGTLTHTAGNIGSATGSSVTLSSAGNGAYQTILGTGLVKATATAGNLTFNNNITAGNGATLAATGDITFVAGATNVTGTASVTSSGARVLFNGANITASNALTVNANSDITQTGGTLTAPALTLVSTGGDITQTAGNMVASGTSTITASGDYNSINLPTATNDFNLLKITGGKTGVTLTDATGFTIGASTFEGSVNMTATTGAIALGSASSDAIVGRWNLKLTANGAGGGITNNADNIYLYGNMNLNTVGAVTISNLGHNFGQISGVVGGNMTIVEKNGLNLGNLNVTGNFSATSSDSIILQKGNVGSLVVGGTAMFSAGSAFAPQDITVNSVGNAVTGAISTLNVKNFTLVNTGNTTYTPLTPLFGLADIKVNGTGSFTAGAVATPVNFSTLKYTGNGAVTINELDAITLQNWTVGGAGAVTVRNNAAIAIGGDITLGAGNVLTTTGTTAITAKAGSIVDTAGASNGVSISGPVTFTNLNSGGLNLANTANKISGNVSITTNTAGAGIVNPGGNAVLANDVTVKLLNVVTGAGSLTVSSANGNITEDIAAGSIMVGNAAGVGAATFSAPNGAVTLIPGLQAQSGTPLGVGTNNFGGVVTVTAKNDSALYTGVAAGAVTNYPLILGNISVTAGRFGATVAKEDRGISQAADTKLNVYGDAGFAVAVGTVGGDAVTGQFGTITLNNVGNSVGGIWLTSGTRADTPVIYRESGSAKVLRVTASASPVSITSDTGDIVQIAGAAPKAGSATEAGQTTPWGGANQYGTYAVNGGTGGLTLNSTSTTGIVLSGDYNQGLIQVNTGTTARDVSMTINGTTTVTTLSPVRDLVITSKLASNNTASGRTVTLTGNLNVTRNLTVTAGSTKSAGTIQDTGRVFVFGNATFDAGNGTAADGLSTITLADNNNSFGSVKFTGGNVTITENQMFNIVGGSVAQGNLALTSYGSLQSKAGDTGMKTVAGNATFNATTDLTLTNWTITGQTRVNALGTADLSTLSLATNLNSQTPINLGNAALYRAPGP
jgi:hypothetical protein